MNPHNDAKVSVEVSANVKAMLERNIDQIQKETKTLLHVTLSNEEGTGVAGMRLEKIS